MDVNNIINTLMENAIPIGLKLVGGIVIWIVGNWLIKLVMRLVGGSLERNKFDSTLGVYIRSILGVLLKVVLVLAVLGFFGVDTTSFAALLAGAGLAIGAAWGGLLANFAAGAFLVVLRPFKVGDFVTIGGVTGTVEDIGLFVTTINTPDNVKTSVGNNKIFSDTIQNFTANPTRRVELVAQLNHSVDYKKAIDLLERRVAAIPNVASDPAPEINIVEFNLAGPVLAVRPYTHNDNYWQVYFDTNHAIKEEFGKAGFPIPQEHYNVQRAS